MKDKHIFRGKSIAHGIWHHGSLVVGLDGEAYIFQGLGCHFEVDPKTIGEFTRLYDMTGERVFEDDILQSINRITGEPLFFQVTFFRGAWCLKDVGGSGEVLSPTEYDDFSMECIVGNVYDNPELLNNGEKS